MEYKVWQLELGGEVIAELEERSYEFPWITARLVNSPRFEQFRDYFSDEDSWPETEEFDALCEEVVLRGRFRLRDRRTNEVFTNVRLNHEGDSVWFRYS